MVDNTISRSRSILCSSVLLGLLSITTSAYGVSEAVKKCMTDALEHAADDMTIGQLRLDCQNKNRPQDHFEPEEENPALVSERMQKDREHILQPFTLMAHKPNYILLGAYNTKGYNADPFQEQFRDPTYGLDDVETKFQLSIKFPLLIDLFDTADIYAAYTNRSFWQLYNSDESEPFRETNHEPEIWVQFDPEWEIFGFTNTWNSFGFNHQSNGRGGALSRSWNRLFAWFTFERGNLAFSFKPWIALVNTSEDGDNPDITDYLGHYEMSASYKWEDHVFSIMSRNNLESGFSKGAVELSWSFPLGQWPYLRGYMQYFSGYGESLIDYDEYVNSVGIGLSLTDWL